MHSEREIGGGDDGNRTRVRGFADRIGVSIERIPTNEVAQRSSAPDHTGTHRKGSGKGQGTGELGATIRRLPVTWLQLPADERLLRLAIQRAFAVGEEWVLFCYICELPFASTAEIHIDHHHATGIPRGLLCRTCNLGLAMFDDHPETMRRAAVYLEADEAAIAAGEALAAR